MSHRLFFRLYIFFKLFNNEERQTIRCQHPLTLRSFPLVTLDYIVSQVGSDNDFCIVFFLITKSEQLVNKRNFSMFSYFLRLHQVCFAWFIVVNHPLSYTGLWCSPAVHPQSKANYFTTSDINVINLSSQRNLGWKVLQTSL